MEDMIYEDGVFVCFYQAEKLMVKIKAPNSIDVLDKKATEQDIARFPQAYLAFKPNATEETFVEQASDDGLIEKATKFFKKKITK